MAFLLARAFGGARAPSNPADAGAFEKLPAFGIDTEDAGFWRSMSLDTAKDFQAPKEPQAAPWGRQVSEAVSDRSGAGTFSRQLSEGASFSRQLSEGASSPRHSPALRGRFFTDGIICKGLNPGGNSEDLQRCGSKEVPDARANSKDTAKVEALRRAEMLARFDHSYDSRRR